MPGVHVTVTSHVSDRDDLRDVSLENASIDPSARWIDFFRFHGVTVKEPHKYCIKSSRHVACMDDQIQDIASWYQRSKLNVKLINNTKSAGGANTPRGRPRRPPPRGRNRIYNKSRNSVAGAGFVGQQQRQQNSGTAGSSGTTIQMDGPPTLPRQVPIANGDSPGPSSQARGGGFQFQEEELINEDETTESPEYAESICSQDSQPEDDSYSEIKKEFMNKAAGIRNVDFQTWQNEISKISGNSDTAYRFKRKIPMLAHFLFDWVDQMKKKREK